MLWFCEALNRELNGVVRVLITILILGNSAHAQISRPGSANEMESDGGISGKK